MTILLWSLLLLGENVNPGTSRAIAAMNLRQRWP